MCVCVRGWGVVCVCVCEGVGGCVCVCEGVGGCVYVCRTQLVLRSVDCFDWLWCIVSRTYCSFDACVIKVVCLYCRSGTSSTH